MVRNYKRKLKYYQWSPEDMDRAVSSVMTGSLGLRAAASRFSVAFSTLQRRVQGMRLTGRPVAHIGHPTLLSTQQERNVSEGLKYLESRGFCLTSNDVRGEVFRFAEDNGIQHPWSKDSQLAGKDWFYLFIKRNKIVGTCENLYQERADGVTKETLEKFYTVLEGVINDFDLRDKPELIYNMDESVLPMNYIPPGTESQNGRGELVSLQDLEQVEHVSVVVCCSANGSYIPPLIIYKGMEYQDEYGENMPPGTLVTLSDTGYINHDLFLMWLKHFQQHRVGGTALLILDGHPTHRCLRTIEFCKENNIELVCLPSYTAHVLQPLDRAVFNSLEQGYQNEVAAFIRKHPERTVTKFQFGEIFSSAWTEAATVEHAVLGFEHTGVFPPNRSIIPEEKCHRPSRSYGSSTNHAVSLTEFASSSSFGGSQTLPVKRGKSSVTTTKPKPKQRRRRRRARVKKQITSSSSESNLDDLFTIDEVTNNIRCKCSKDDSYFHSKPIAPCEWNRCHNCDMMYHEIGVNIGLHSNFKCTRCR